MVDHTDIVNNYLSYSSFLVVFKKTISLAEGQIMKLSTMTVFVTNPDKYFHHYFVFLPRE
uniref:(California timema) hypothetical protein n=1 Tax=Timema californicum TaxID=61474 RepID=A0A7R9P4S5_TIMCA|nr:unnamed protein product [Timema californicum]